MDTSHDGDPFSPVHSEMGLLSQTLSCSSAAKWVIPARIRNASRNDVVFIGDTSIQLREFVTTSEAHLLDVTGKFTFRTPILAAKVITATAEPIDFADQVVQQTVEEERYVVGDKPLPDDHPPQILVLSLASCELVFVYAQEHPDGTVAFQWARRPVMSGVDLPDEFGRHLAVDPGSRALAFAPSIGYFAIASLRPVDDIKTDIDEWKPASPKTFLPWTEQHFIQVDGYVVKMDFLECADDDPSKVILVLLVANAGETSLLLYRWDTRSQLHRIKPMRCSGQVLSQEDSFPLMLIPCRGLASFFLVTETELVLYSQVTASQARRSAYPLPANGPNEPPRSRRLLWTQWAKPRRHRQYNTTNDDVMLVREDGLLQYFMIVHKPNPRANISTSAGHLGFDVDTAFCMLPTPRTIGGGDILIAGGNMNNGGVFHLEPRQAPRQMQALSNPAPFRDLLLLNSDSTKLPHLNKRHLYTCCGSKDGRGALVKVHHGIEAQIGWTMAHSDAASIERIWTIEAQHQEILLILFSHSLHSTLILFKVRTTELEYANNETHPDIEFDCPTLAAARLGDDVFVQLTDRNINILSFSHKFPAIRREFKTIRPLCAAIMESPGLVFAGYPTLDGFAVGIIDLRKNAVDDDPFVPTISLQSQPVGLHPARFNETPVVFVSTEQGHLAAFVVEENLKLGQLFDLNLSEIDESIEDPTVSSICLLSHPSSEIGLLLCGLRSGCLLCIDLKATKEKTGRLHVDYENGEPHMLGSTTVSISPDNNAARQGSITSAFAVCRSAIKLVSLKNNTAGADFSITSVYVADRESPSPPFPIINVSHRVQRLESDPSSDISGLLICATADTVLFTSLAARPGAVLQHAPVPGVPKCLIRSSFLEQLVVGVDTSEGPRIVFLAPSSNDSDQPTYSPSQSVTVGSAAERICAMINYQPTENNAHLQLLAIALNSTQLDPLSGALIPTGNVVCLSLKRIQRGKADSASPQPVRKLRGHAVTALCSCGKTSMLIGTDKAIILQDFDLATRAWEQHSSYDLPSAVVNIDVRGGQISVATQRHSLMQFKEFEKHLVLVDSDTQARNTKQVLTFGGRKSLLLMSMSEKGTTITGLAEDPLAGGLGKVFEGSVPLLIDRLVEETEGLPSIRERSSFIGSTRNGTLYRFLTLKLEEWQLLKFLEGLFRERKGPAKRREASRAKKPGTTSENLRARSLNTHVDGDALAGMVEMGVMNLREVLGPRIKEENESKGNQRNREERIEGLRQVAAPLIGETEDIVGAAIIWLRRMLNWQLE